jgi:hypothetical protein
MDSEGFLFIGEHRMGPEFIDCFSMGHRVNVYSKTGERMERLGDATLGDGPTEFIAPHGMGVDSQGNVYVGEVSRTVWGGRFDPPRIYRCFRKLRRIS